MRRTLLACAGIIFVAFAAGGALLASVGRSAVMDADRAEAATRHERARGSALAADAHRAGIEVRAVLGHVEATARSLASDASRAFAALEAADPASSGRGDVSLVETEWVPASDRGLYMLRRARLADVVALDAWAGALRIAAAPGSGVARAALRLDCGVEVGAPGSIAVVTAIDPQADRTLRRALLGRTSSGDPDETRFDLAPGWTHSGILAPDMTYVAPVTNSVGSRIGAIVCEADMAAITAALDTAAARLDGARPILVSADGRVVSAATGADGVARAASDEEFDAALAAVATTIADHGIPDEGAATVTGSVDTGMARLAGTPFVVGAIRTPGAPGGSPGGEDGLVAAAASRVALGVVGVSLVFGLGLLWAAKRLGAQHDERMSALLSTSDAHCRGDYTRQAPASGEDDVAELGAWLNTAALRLRHSLSRADESERRLTSLIESMADGFVTTNAEDRITFVNQRFCELIGRPSHQILGKYVEELLLPDSLQRYRTEATRRREKRPSRYEVQWSGARASHPRTIVSGVPLFDEEGRLTGSYGVITDITDKVRAHEETARAEKVRALGEMAGGVAHDFNNLLTVILGNTQYLLLDAVSDEMRQTLRTIERAALDGTETVRRIREFSKNRTAATSALPLDPNQVIDDVVSAMRRRFEEEGRARDAVFQVEVQRRSRRKVRANEQELREALTHVVQNAIEAMPKGGKLVVDAFDRGEDAVGIRIEDTGCGMTPEQIQKMFDPFFTTKQGGRCAGLGLSIAYGIVRAHRGLISAKSEPGRGTTLTIVLPAEASVNSARSTMTGAAPKARATEEPRVLYVTTPAGDVLGRELRTLGLNVAAVQSPSSALGLVADAGIFNTLLVDHDLAGTTGWELARQARGVRGNIRILLLTDSDHPVDATQARNAGIDRVLTRPFDARDVHGEVFSMLVAAPARRPADVRVPRRGASAPRLPKEQTGDACTSEIWDPKSGAQPVTGALEETTAPILEPEPDEPNALFGLADGPTTPMPRFDAAALAASRQCVTHDDDRADSASEAIDLPAGPATDPDAVPVALCGAGSDAPSDAHGDRTGDAPSIDATVQTAARADAGVTEPVAGERN